LGHFFLVHTVVVVVVVVVIIALAAAVVGGAGNHKGQEGSAVLKNTGNWARGQMVSPS